MEQAFDAARSGKGLCFVITQIARIVLRLQITQIELRLQIAQIINASDGVLVETGIFDSLDITLRTGGA